MLFLRPARRLMRPESTLVDLCVSGFTISFGDLYLCFDFFDEDMMPGVEPDVGVLFFLTTGQTFLISVCDLTFGF